MRDALKTEELHHEMKKSMNNPVDLLNSQMTRMTKLALKETLFQTFSTAEGLSIDRLWEKCTEVNSDIQVLSNS